MIHAHGHANSRYQQISALLKSWSIVGQVALGRTCRRRHDMTII